MYANFYCLSLGSGRRGCVHLIGIFNSFSAVETERKWPSSAAKFYYFTFFNRLGRFEVAVVFKHNKDVWRESERENKRSDARYTKISPRRFGYLLKNYAKFLLIWFTLFDSLIRSRF